MSEEPINVRVARALGWEPWNHRFCGPRWRKPGDAHPYKLPDFFHDTDFLWRVLSENRLDVDAYKSHCEVGHFGRGTVRGTGKTLAEAVLLWLIAAKDSGVEVKL